MKLYIFLILFALSATSCVTETDKRQDSNTQMINEAVSRCMEKGGVPVYSAWVPVMTDCKFPPVK